MSNRNLTQYGHIAIFLIVGTLVTNCGKTLSGAEALAKVSSLLSFSKVSEAEKFILRLPKTYENIKALDPDDPEYCSANGIKYKVDTAGYDLSRYLVDLKKRTSNSLEVYALAHQKFLGTLEALDQMAPLCSGVSAQVDFESARQPLAAEIDTELRAMKEHASAMTKGDFETQVAAVVADEKAKEAADHDKMCSDEISRTPNETESPLVKSAHEQILAGCLQ